ncbi:KpsF/GutQ family protein [Isosphaera pallida ATCC 43644]|uniref:KpsF/GutQ family protein n=1 Tax=Isosphaera pallida (strain ATCC 43644 / DSM 9630 / IS1B) TaxID=575540 RepID=E8R633_ISOPI|nr:KpsF/GutQ family sugar-phosphate isomerase [Isosphaera pallida]ADV60728.1 KpsF/GutQ family protein [Isosphaera pallida ATCC 43644]
MAPVRAAGIVEEAVNGVGGSPLADRGKDRPFTDAEALEFARRVVRIEAATLERVADRLDEGLVRVADRLGSGRALVFVLGVGKSGLVGEKLAATLASTGTRAFPLHPAEALHGDLGRVREGDVALLLSASGETEELLKIVPPLKALGAVLVAITCHERSALARKADERIILGPIEEACPLGLAPSATTTAMMAVGDALALLVSRCRGFDARGFVKFHPGGALGRKLTRVEEVMRSGPHVRIARESEITREVLVRLGGASRRAGAILIVDDRGVLTGIFTDSDLARLFERQRDYLLERPIVEAMTRAPSLIRAGRSLAEALDALQARKLSELPVIDEAGRPIGLIDVTDLLGMVPPHLLQAETDEPAKTVAAASSESGEEVP